MRKSPTLHLARRDELPTLLNSLGLTRTGAELGVYRGEFAEVILRRWCGECLILVDAWRHLPDYYDSWNYTDSECEANLFETQRRLAAYSGRFRILRALTVEAAIAVEDLSLDFIYIDANHSYQSVTVDLETWYPKVRSGGLLSGHDYFDALADENLEPDFGRCREQVGGEQLTSYGVKSAVDQFADRHGYAIATTAESYPSWLFQKK